MKSKLAPIVDADYIVYGCGFASDSSKDADGNKVEEPLEYCLHSVKKVMAELLSNFEDIDNARILLQGSGNYRERIATILPYKGNRDPNKRPSKYHEIREYLIDTWNAELITGMETDDAVGIEQWSHKDRSTCIVSVDKDLDMIPGWHYNPRKKELYYIDLATANRKFWLQALTGDTTDNIQGIPKVGPKNAEKILAGSNTWTDMELAVRQAYNNKFGKDGPRYFHENATLLWIQREYNINYDGSLIVKEESNEEACEAGISPEGQDENTSVS